MSRIRYAGLALAAILLTASPAVADTGLHIELHAEAVDAKGRHVPADQAAPGDIIQYSLLHENQGSSALSGIASTLPIPDGVTYLPGSASPAPQQASLDGVTYSAVPLTRKVATEDGGEQIVPIPASEYRFLRWRIEAIPAGETAEVDVSVQLDPRF